MTGSKKKTDVVIPTYNRKNYLKRLLKQLNEQVVHDVDLFIVVVVDGSTDGTLEMLKTQFPDIDVIRGDGNWWWTKSVNEGIKFAIENDAESILLMNDDTEIDTQYVSTLLKANQQYPDAIIGSLNLSIEKPHRIYFSGVKKIIWWKARSVRYHKIFDLYKKNLTGLHKSVLLMGRGMFIPVSIFKKIGFFDENAFPQYKADLDFVLTANENNIKTYISWDSIVYSHLELTGKGATYTNQNFFEFLGSFFKQNTYTNLKQSFRYYKKHCPIFLLPFSYFVDKLRLIYSFLKKRKLLNKIQGH
jgi:GT2 family glycosyltransferase